MAAELLSKLGEMCGSPVSLRLQLSTQDLDVLATVTSDEDLVNLIEKYDRASPPPSPPTLKIRAFIFPPKSAAGETLSTHSYSPSSSSSSSLSMTAPRFPAPAKPPLTTCTLCLEKLVGKVPYRGCYAHGNPSHIHLVHDYNHWQ